MHSTSAHRPHAAAPAAPAALTTEEAAAVAGGAAVRTQTLPSGTVVYRSNGPAPIGYDDASTQTCHP